MLTGDKLETAENIAVSCNLFKEGMQILSINASTIQALKEYFDANKGKGSQETGMLVDGDSLVLILSKDELRRQFIEIAKDCGSVVCCRTTPNQKAEVVRLVRESLGKLTLAIGDGANDVNMIQDAHIGIGIYGNEGRRAAQASDFAIGEFRGLWRLLFLHGR